MTPQNPYESTGNGADLRKPSLSVTQPLLTLVWLGAYLYPMVALGGVYLVVFMHENLQMRGAPMGVALILSVFMIGGALFVWPVGLHWSFCPPRDIRTFAGSQTRFLPIYFVIISVATIAMVFWDPWRIVEIYQD
jgi:hypothetical protein